MKNSLTTRARSRISREIFMAYSSVKICPENLMRWIDARDTNVASVARAIKIEPQSLWRLLKKRPGKETGASPEVFHALLDHLRLKASDIKADSGSRWIELPDDLLRDMEYFARDRKQTVAEYLREHVRARAESKKPLVSQPARRIGNREGTQGARNHE